MIVLVLSENANAAPHIEREIAHAFYMRRIIIPFRLAETLPRREILFYLSNVPWFNAVNPPAEEQLEALTARIKGLMPGSAARRRRYSSSKCEKENGIVKPFQLVVRSLTSFSLPNPGNLEMDRDHNIPLCSGVIFVVCPPANERMGVTGGGSPPIYGPWFQPFSDSIASGWGRRIGVKTNPHLYAFRLVAGWQTLAPRLWFRDLRIRLSIRQQSRQPTRLLHRNAKLPQGSELGDWPRSLALVTYRPLPIESHMIMIIINNFRNSGKRGAKNCGPRKPARFPPKPAKGHRGKSASNSKNMLTL